MDLFQKYKNMKIDGELINLKYAEITVAYYCYPKDAKVIGFEGCILYCFLPQYGDIVFAADPENYSDRKVFPLARTFKEFLRLIITCGSVNPVEQIINLPQGQFDQCLQEIKANQTDAQAELITRLCDEFLLTPINNPYQYVKDLQTDFDYGNIQFSDEYYDTLGIEQPF